MKDIMKMTKKDFHQIPSRRWDKTTENVSSIIILPSKTKHDSGYSVMEFVLINEKQEAICKVSGSTDILHIDGIGGYGCWDAKDGIPKTKKPVSWSIDCLPNGLLRLFCYKPIKVGIALSSLEIFAMNNK